MDVEATEMPYCIIKKSKIPVIIAVIIIIYLLAPSYIIAFAIKMPFPYVLFPPVGKELMYDADNYSCYEQSCEIEKVLEAHGIHVYGMSGYKAKEALLLINKSTGQIDYDLKGYDYGHRWVLIDFGIFKMPFDATMMLPISTEWFPTYHFPFSFDRRYQVVIKDEGVWDGTHEIYRNNQTLDNIIIQ